MANTPATKRRKPNTARGSSRSPRLEARITGAQKAMIERAAETVINDHEIIRLNQAHSRAFVEALLNPPAPNAALRKATRRHERLVESR